MNLLYFGFALADSMFVGDCVIKRKVLTICDVKQILTNNNVISCCNPSHKATIAVLKSHFRIDIEIPTEPPKVTLAGYHDRIVIMSVRGLPRLTDRHEYSELEVASATFEFSLYTVLY